MDRDFKNQAFGAAMTLVVGLIVAGVTTGMNHKLQLSDSYNREKQQETDAQRANMVDFTQSLESMVHNLEKKDVRTFE